jgi:hypothetical protein
MLVNDIRVQLTVCDFGVGATPGTEQGVLLASHPSAQQRQQNGNKNHAVAAQSSDKGYQCF